MRKQLLIIHHPWTWTCSCRVNGLTQLYYNLTNLVMVYYIYTLCTCLEFRRWGFKVTWISNPKLDSKFRIQKFLLFTVICEFYKLHLCITDEIVRIFCSIKMKQMPSRFSVLSYDKYFSDLIAQIYKKPFSKLLWNFAQKLCLLCFTNYVLSIFGS